MRGWCRRCSVGDHKVFHGRGNKCDRDPRLPVNVIAARFRQKSPEYVGIVWEAIANNCLYALEDAGFRLVKTRGKRESNQ